MVTFTTASESVNRDPSSWLLTLTSHAEGSVTVPYKVPITDLPGRKQDYDLMDLNEGDLFFFIICILNLENWKSKRVLRCNF